MLRALGRLLLQGALRVALVAVTTAGVVGFLSLIARASQVPGQTLADAKAPSRRVCPAIAAQSQRPFCAIINSESGCCAHSSRARSAELYRYCPLRDGLESRRQAPPRG